MEEANILSLFSIFSYFNIFKPESYPHQILFPLQDKILEYLLSLLFAEERAPIVVHNGNPTIAIFE